MAERRGAEPTGSDRRLCLCIMSPVIGHLDGQIKGDHVGAPPLYGNINFNQLGDKKWSSACEKGLADSSDHFGSFIRFGYDLFPNGTCCALSRLFPTFHA